MSAADIRPDYGPDGHDGPQVAAGIAVLIVAAVAVAGVIAALLVVLDGIR